MLGAACRAGRGGTGAPSCAVGGCGSKLCGCWCAVAVAAPWVPSVARACDTARPGKALGPTPVSRQALRAASALGAPLRDKGAAIGWGATGVFRLVGPALAAGRATGRRVGGAWREAKSFFFAGPARGHRVREADRPADGREKTVRRSLLLRDTQRARTSTGSGGWPSVVDLASPPIRRPQTHGVAP